MDVGEDLERKLRLGFAEVETGFKNEDLYLSDEDGEGMS